MSNAAKALNAARAKVAAASAKTFCKGISKVKGIGKEAAEKMKEFMEAGASRELEMKRRAQNI